MTFSIAEVFLLFWALAASAAAYVLNKRISILQMVVAAVVEKHEKGELSAILEKPANK